MERETNQNELRPVSRKNDLLKWGSLFFLFLFVLIIFTLIASDLLYLLNREITFDGLLKILTSKEVLSAMRLSIFSSLTTLVLVIIFSVPIGYALSRYPFPGQALLNTIVDIPLILPPVVIGVSLLAFFGTHAGMYIKSLLKAADLSLVSGIGIVMGQFLVSISYCIRATKASFDSVDQNLEKVGLSFGASPWQAFWRITFPLSRNGLIAGAVMAWARAIGVFGPLMVFVGTGPRVQVMPTAMWLELSIGNIEVSLTIALMMVIIAGVALSIVHWLAPGRKWS